MLLLPRNRRWWSKYLTRDAPVLLRSAVGAFRGFFMQYNRGGKSLIAGDIGRYKILRQHLLLPGERLRTSVSGNVRLSALRQQTSVYLNASIEAFAAPLRWYYPNFPTYIQEGISTAETIPTVSTGWTDIAERGRQLGIGDPKSAFCRWFIDHPVQVFNSWYRWPEDTKHAISPALTTFWANWGQPCVNLPFVGSRLHTDPETDMHTSEHEVPSATIFDVRTLQHYQARFAQAIKADWTSMDRYNQFMHDIFGARGNNEVDKIPTRLKSGASLGVSPRDMYATDGASLGEIASLNNFKVSHSWGDYVAREHEIVCYIMVLRFAPIVEDNVIPAAYPAETNYTTYQGDPHILANQEPQPVASMEIESGGDSTDVGFAPAGWQWREGHTHVDFAVKKVNNFPLLDGSVHTAAGYRDASAINSATFRSTALRHYFGDLDFKCNVQSQIGEAGLSILSGAGQDKAKQHGLGKGNHPMGGYHV